MLNNVLFGFYQNCRGPRTKLNILNSNVACFNYIFIVLTENRTNLNENIANGELDLFNYNIFRCDRNSATCSCSL